MKQIKILTVTSSENSAKAETLLDGENINRMLTLRPKQENLERAISMPVDAAVLVSSELTAEESFFMERLYMNRGKIAFILICREASADILSRAMRCGISCVLTMDMRPSEICAGIAEETHRVQTRNEYAEVREYDSKVLSVFSTKGGTGKTSIAVNLAVALQQCGKKTAVVDLDLQFGDVGTFFNVPRCDTISDLVSEPNLNPSTVNSFLYKHGSGVQILCAPVSPELGELVKTEHVDRILTVLRTEFDYVICDLTPSLDDVSLFALDRSDEVLFITNPEIPTLKNTRTCMGVLSALNYSSKIRLILNRDGDPYVKRRDIRNALDMEPVLCIPYDAKVSSLAVNRGIPVVEASPRSAMGRAIMQFAKEESGLIKPKRSKKSKNAHYEEE